MENKYKNYSSSIYFMLVMRSTSFKFFQLKQCWGSKNMILEEMISNLHDNIPIEYNYLQLTKS